jgi:hypothetical protein
VSHLYRKASQRTTTPSPTRPDQPTPLDQCAPHLRRKATRGRLHHCRPDPGLGLAHPRQTSPLPLGHQCTSPRHRSLLFSIRPTRKPCAMELVPTRSTPIHTKAKLSRPPQVKKKNPMTTQITAKQILREVRELRVRCRFRPPLNAFSNEPGEDLVRRIRECTSFATSPPEAI